MKEPLPIFVLGSIALLMAMPILGLIGFGCASTTQAITNSCLAVKLADDACALVEVPGPDGGPPVMVKLSGPELREHAARKAAEHAVDGGAK